MTSLRASLICFAIGAAASCSNNSPSSPSAVQLNGTWRIATITPAGSGFQVSLPPEITYEITFEGSRASARINCNTCNGAFAGSRSEVTIGPALACTRVACGTPVHEPLDQEVLSMLSGTHTSSPNVNGVTLRSSRGSMALRRK